MTDIYSPHNVIFRRTNKMIYKVDAHIDQYNTFHKWQLRTNNISYKTLQTDGHTDAVSYRVGLLLINYNIIRISILLFK